MTTDNATDLRGEPDAFDADEGRTYYDPAEEAAARLSDLQPSAGGKG